MKIDPIKMFGPILNLYLKLNSCRIRNKIRVKICFDSILLWGRKFPYIFIRYCNHTIRKNVTFIEDGFISKVSSTDILSLVKDFEGIYYDSNTKSFLEDLIIQKIDLNQHKRANFIIQKILKYGISKYNLKRDYKKEIPSNYVLIIDQIEGDLSIKYGQGDTNSFRKMLSEALSDYPNHQIIVKIHPDVFSRKKRGCLNINYLKENPRIQIIAENCHPFRLIRESDAVYTVTSQVGFEALILGKKVKCFGMPFYAGWGLTEDVLPAPKRRKNVSLEQLVYAALVKYPIYFDPETNEITTVEKTIEYIFYQRQMRFRFPETLYAYGFTPWKKSILKSFTQGSELIFLKRLEDVPNSSTLLVWGSHDCEEIGDSVKLIRVEDGFLRSVGLGSVLISPQSWVFDNEGIYYDSSKRSQLESILNESEFKAKELKRADDLIERITKNQVSKYNLGNSHFQIKNSGKSVILVIGQVEKDASIRFGTDLINTNLKLLQVVRKKFPKAYIIYKPHPDVVAGIRRKGENESLEKNYYDLEVKSGDAISLFKYVDSVHTMTSLVGFEALLRNKKVYTYGLPFYAGWGLTVDAMSIKRRCRQLSLDELVAGSLIRYPSYISNTSRMYTSPERVVEELIQQKEKANKRMPLWRKFIRDLLKIWSHSNLRSNA